MLSAPDPPVTLSAPAAATIVMPVVTADAVIVSAPSEWVTVSIWLKVPDPPAP